MTEQLSRHPHRRVEPHPLDGMLFIASKLITAPVRGLQYVERSLTGSYTTSQDFFARYQWTKHHVEDLHKSLESPNFWIKWSQEGHTTYVEVQTELLTLQRQREKAHAICTHQGRYLYPRSAPTRAIACTDLAPLATKLQGIHHRITKASGQSYIDKRQKDATTIQTSIESLKNAPTESSWETWLLKHQATCQAIESNILSLNHTTYLYVDTQEKLQGINTGELNTLFYTALVDIAKAHYTAHAEKEYAALYEGAQKELNALQQNYTTYHKTWGNYLWSQWEKDHQSEAHTLYTTLRVLNDLHNKLTTINRVSPSSLSSLRRSFNTLFRSYKIPEGLSPFHLSIPPSTWKTHPHKGTVIYTGEPHLTNTLQLIFSDPTLAAQTIEKRSELKTLYDWFLKSTWNTQWEALYQLITETLPTKPTYPYDRFLATYHRLSPTQPISLSMYPETPLPKATLTIECVPNQTLETLLNDSILENPPELLIIEIERTRETQDTPVGLQEEFFLLPTYTASRKGAAYKLVSFTTAGAHYRTTPFGYIRIDRTVEIITQLDFLIAAQTATTCVLRRAPTKISEPQLLQQAHRNHLRFISLQFKMCALHAIHGQSNFKIPASHQTTFRHLVDFIQRVTKEPSTIEQIFGKNPNDDLEQTFKKLPKNLQDFLLNILQAPSKNPALLRDLRSHLLTSEESLSIPPIPGQQQHDLDRFVLTLIADKLVKHLETDSLSEEKLFLLQATLHAVSQSVQAKQKRVIRYSAVFEETIQFTVTLAFSNYLEKGEEFVIRQALTSSSRLITTLADPLQEYRLFQTAMRITTSITLLGQTLDNPELSEEDIRSTGLQFFSRQGLALVSLESVPQPVKDLAIATLSSAIFRSPSHLINWGVSTTFTLINTALIDDLPPDVPQPAINFYAARVLNPLSTNALLQAIATEKVTQLTLHLLRSSEDSDHTTEDLIPTIPIDEEAPKVEMHDEALFLRLVKEQEQNVKDLATAQTELDDPDYSEFGSPKDTLIQKEAGVTEAKKKLDEKEYKEGDTWGPWQARRAEEKTEKAQDNYNDAVRGRNTVKTHITNLETRISKLNIRIANNSQAQLEASAPKHIVAPNPIQKAFPIIKHTNTVCTLTPSGEIADRVTFSTRDQAESIRTFQAGHEVDIYTCQTMSFEMKKQAVQHGVSIESLPGCEAFVQTQLQVKVHSNRHFSLLINGKTAHTFKGSDAFTQLEGKLFHYRTLDQGANQRTLNQHQAQLSSLTNAPINQTRLPQSERRHLTAEMLPPVKTEKEHGAWFNGWRSAKAAGSRGVQWLHDIGLAEASVNVVQTGINAPKPSRSTPNHAGTYGVDVAKTSSISTTSLSGPITTAGRPTETWGWQNVEDMQRDTVMRGLEQTINANRQSFSGMPQNPIDYQSMWGEGIASNVQLPPMEVSSLGRNDANVVSLRPSYDRPLQMAGLLPFVVSKVVPEQTKIKVETWVKNYIQQWKNDPIAAKKDLDICLILGAKKGILIAIQAFEQPSLKTRPNAFGLMEVSDRCDNWVAQKMKIDLTSPNAQLGMFVGEFAMPIPLIGASKHCTKVGQEAFIFMRQSARFMKPQPLLGRALAFPQVFGQQVRAIEALQQPVYRSGFVSEKAVQQARKAVNLPAFKKMTIKLGHTASGHLIDGYRAMCKGSKKSLFPEGTTKQQLEKIIEHAYKNCKKVRTQQGERHKVLVRGKYEGMEVDMWVNTRDKVIETAYPRSKR